MSERPGPRVKKIAKPTPQTLSTASPHAARPPGKLSPGFTYKLGERIGEDLTVIGHLSAGKISELYQVWSTSFTCALTCKILLPGFGPGSKEVRGFRREAKLLKRLAHPSIVRIFGQGAFEDRDYLVQEYLHGPSLFQLVDTAPQRRLPISDALKATIHVCAGIDHLHSFGYIHRDIKPANIILRGGIPVLVDFDVAYRLKAGRKPLRDIGTDPYMAPEQCLRHELSPATDIYALGAVLYEMLTGRWAYEDEWTARSEVRTLEGRYPQVRLPKPAPPSRFNPEVSKALDRLVLKCLAREPGCRFQTVRALVRALARLMEGEDKMWPDAADVQRHIA